MQPHDWLVAASLFFGALNAWQNNNIQLAIAKLRGELVERIAQSEGDIKTLRALSKSE